MSVLIVTPVSEVFELEHGGPNPYFRCKLYADVPLSEQAISHAVDMARTEAHKLGDEEFQRAFAQALWRQWCAQALPEYNAYLMKEVKAICTCGFTCDANGNPGDEHIPRWKVTDLLE